jgi:phosphohistidine phosphatase
VILILTRHAKSDWGSGARDDHDRPLNERGRRDAPRIGAWLVSRGYVPESVAVSTARRTRETWAMLSSAFPAPLPETRVVFSDALYHADPEAILGHIHAARTGCHMIVGHNPGIAVAAHALCRTPPAHPRFGTYPTGATLVLETAEADWSGVEWQTARVLDFVTPHDLPD